jgi:hypothetical protein
MFSTIVRRFWISNKGPLLKALHNNHNNNKDQQILVQN